MSKDPAWRDGWHWWRSSEWADRANGQVSGSTWWASASDGWRSRGNGNRAGPSEKWRKGNRSYAGGQRADRKVARPALGDGGSASIVADVEDHDASAELGVDRLLAQLATESSSSADVMPVDFGIPSVAVPPEGTLMPEVPVGSFVRCYPQPNAASCVRSDEVGFSDVAKEAPRSNGVTTADDLCDVCALSEELESEHVQHAAEVEHDIEPDILPVCLTDIVLQLMVGFTVCTFLDGASLLALRSTNDSVSNALHNPWSVSAPWPPSGACILRVFCQDSLRRALCSLLGRREQRALRAASSSLDKTLRSEAAIHAGAARFQGLGMAHVTPPTIQLLRRGGIDPRMMLSLRLSELGSMDWHTPPPPILPAPLNFLALQDLRLTGNDAFRSKLAQLAARSSALRALEISELALESSESPSGRLAPFLALIAPNSLTKVEIRNVRLPNIAWGLVLGILLSNDRGTIKPPLEHLALPDTRLPQSTLSAVLSLADVTPRLRILNLDDNGAAFAAGGSKLFTGASFPMSLEQLSLRRNRIEGAAAVALCKALRGVVALRGLHLHLNPIGDLGTTSLVELLREGVFPRMLALDVSACRLGSRSFEALCSVLGQSACRVLSDLSLSSQAELSARSLPSLTASLCAQPSAIRVLCLDSCPKLLAGPGLQEFGAALGACRSLSSLSLSHNKLGDRGIGILASGLGQARRLRRLLLRGNRLTAEGARALAFFGLGPALRELRLKGNSLGDEGVVAICEALAGRPRVEVLEVSGNEVTKAGAAEAREILATSALECNVVALEVDVYV